MAQLVLRGGAYQARSIIANAQRCINLYSEINPPDSPTPVTYYQRPGLKFLVQGPNNPVRGLYRASNGNGYCVIGQQVFAIQQGFVLESLGFLQAPLDTPVSMIDNGVNLLLVDNSTLGYTINLSTNAFAQVVDSTGIFTGATRVDILDGFTLWNIPNSPSFGSTLDNTLTFDALFTAAKTSYPDLLQTIVVNRQELLLLGTLKGEIWYDAGNLLFPFARVPGINIEHGCIAPFSIASQDICVYWLGQDLQGQGIVFRFRGYETSRVSNHALEYQISQMIKNGHPISDAIGYTYQQGGHVFYVLIFPSGNQTWVYDEASTDWHQRCWTDLNGNLNRDRTNCHAFIQGLNVVGDWQNGTLYALDHDYYFDNVNGISGPISFIRSFPHIIMANSPLGMVPSNGQMMTFRNFMVDLECGNGPINLDGLPASIGLRWSEDRGKTFGNTVLQSTGNPGEYLARPTWSAMGISRDMIFELEWSFAGKSALNGAWVEATIMPKVG